MWSTWTLKKKKFLPFLRKILFSFLFSVIQITCWGSYSIGNPFSKRKKNKQKAVEKNSWCYSTAESPQQSPLLIRKEMKMRRLEICMQSKNIPEKPYSTSWTGEAVFLFCEQELYSSDERGQEFLYKYDPHQKWIQ